MDNYTSNGQGIARTATGPAADRASPPTPGVIHQLADSQSKLLSRLSDLADRTGLAAEKVFGPAPEAANENKVVPTHDGIAYLAQQHVWQHTIIDRIYAALERLERL